MALRFQKPEPAVTPAFVTLQMAARLTLLGLNTVRDHIRAGRIRTVRLGRRVMIPKEEMERILRDGIQI